LTNFFPIVDIMFRCRDMFSQSSKSVPQNVFLPQPLAVSARESSDQIFQIEVISEYMFKFVEIRSVTSKIRRRKKKKRKKNQQR